MKTFHHAKSRRASKPIRKPSRSPQSRMDVRRVAWGGKRSQTAPTSMPAYERAAASSAGLSFARVPSSSRERLSSEDVLYKLRVGLSTDPREREADQIANNIMSMPKPYSPAVRSNWASSPSKGTMQLQRECSSCVKDDKKAAGGKRLPEDDETVGAKLKGTSTQINRSREMEIRGFRGGHRLPESERKFFEPRFGLDFSQVQLYTDSTAQASANALNAKAYTHRNNIVFGSGQYTPGTAGGRWLMAHELAHVVQQQGAGKMNAIQRDLATPPPKEAPAPQDALSEGDIKKAIKFNKRRYNKPGTRLIQDIVGSKPTGTWVDADIVAVARIQEQYGLKKDGKVGTKFFKFLDEELKAEKVSKADKHCLTALNIRKGSENIVPRANGASMTRTFHMDAQLPSHCKCADYEYRQFISGHFTHERAGVVTDEGNWFANLPAGRLNAAWQEDGHTGATALNYGHRAQPAEDINRYLNDSFGLNMANGCLYRGEDTPGGNYSGWNVASPTTGDVLDIEMKFRGEIQRKGKVVRKKHWTALKRRFTLP